jgi:hypothetical protein
MIKNNSKLNYKANYDTGLIEIDKADKQKAERELLD